MRRPSRRRGGTPVALALVLIVAVTAWIYRDHRASDDPPVSSATATVARVIDGDTIDVDTKAGESQRVRVLGINTPEIRHRNGGEDQCGGPEATQKLEGILPTGTTVRLVADSRADDHDRYDRALRYVETSDGTDVGAQLLEDGYAYPWKPRSAPAPDRYATYQEAALDAQDANAGSWDRCPTFNHSK